MGCCFSSTFTSTTAASKTDQKNQNSPKRHHSPLKPPMLQSHKSPPPPPEEEESVIKEVLVLSETPKLHDKQQEKITQTLLALPPKTQTEVSSPIKEQQEQQQQQQQEQETSDLSQLSEIYNISETRSTTSTTTTTATATKGLKEDEATSKENSEVKLKSPAKVIKERPSSGDPGSVRARRVDPQPEKKARGRGRGLGEVRTVQRNVGSRSRSPGTERAGGVGNGAVGRSPTTVTGKTDNKPIGTATVEGQSKREEDGNSDVMEQQQRTESLENPLVSLECFIFL